MNKDRKEEVYRVNEIVTKCAMKTMERGPLFIVVKTVNFFRSINFIQSFMFYFFVLQYLLKWKTN